MRGVIIVGSLLLARCADSGGGDGALAATPYPTPENAATAAALTMECDSGMWSEGSPDYFDEDAGYAAPEEVLAHFPYETFSPLKVFQDQAPDFTYESNDRVVWVYLNGRGQKVATIAANRTLKNRWQLGNIAQCSPLEP